MQSRNIDGAAGRQCMAMINSRYVHGGERLRSAVRRLQRAGRRNPRLEAVAPMGRRLGKLLVPLAFAISLFLTWSAAEPVAGPRLDWQPAKFSANELPARVAREPLEGQPALSRGGAAVVAVESSRRKHKISQRPAADPVILTCRFIGVGHHEHGWHSGWSGPPIKRGEPAHAFLARGPPLRHWA